MSKIQVDFSHQSLVFIQHYRYIPVVPHKAVVEVSEKEPTGAVDCGDSRMTERIH